VHRSTGRSGSASPRGGVYRLFRRLHVDRVNATTLRTQYAERSGPRRPQRLIPAVVGMAGATVARLTHYPASPPEPHRTPAESESARRRFGSDLRAGFAYHRAEPVAGRLLLLSMVGVIGVASVNVASAVIIHRLGQP